MTIEEAQEWLDQCHPNRPWSVQGGNPVLIGLPCKDGILLYYAVTPQTIGGQADLCIKMTEAVRAI